ncbi:MAG: DUF63 family protein [Halobacteriales archaeon]
MALLPAGFALPPLPYLLGLLAIGGGIAVGLWRRQPAVSTATVLGLVPWMAIGSALHALYVLEAAPPVVAPLLGTPAVYATGFIALGAVWLAADSQAPDAVTVARQLGLIGGGVFALTVGAVLLSGDRPTLVWPLAGLISTALIVAAAWELLKRAAPEVAVTGGPGALVLFGHGLDGVSTAIGVDLLRFGERTPASRVILDIAAGLPTAETLGVGWLFVVVKLGVAAVVVALFVELVEENPRQGYLLLALVAALGLGPGVHNLLLYAVAA